MRRQMSFQGERSTGTLYLVATPIGNLGDMTFRAVETLKSVAVIAAEDTRQTRKLLTHFQIEGPRVVAYHEHNKNKQEDWLLDMLQAGQDVAVVSDAGTPGISDPGSDLVHSAIKKGLTVTTIPGACAAISALIGSGLRTNQFSFVGFLPRDRKARKKELELWKRRQETLIFYEAPHRVKEMLRDVQEVFEDRQIVIARELTKRFEEYARGSVSQVLAWIEEEAPRGEWVIVVDGASEEMVQAGQVAEWWEELSIPDHVTAWIEKGFDKKEAIKKTAKERGLPKREVYQLVLEEE